MQQLLYSSPPSPPLLPSPSPSQPHLHNWLHTARAFQAYIFGCVSVRALELLTQALWLLEFL